MRPSESLLQIHSWQLNWDMHYGIGWRWQTTLSIWLCMSSSRGTSISLRRQARQDEEQQERPSKVGCRSYERQSRLVWNASRCVSVDRSQERLSRNGLEWSYGRRLTRRTDCSFDCSRWYCTRCTHVRANMLVEEWYREGLIGDGRNSGWTEELNLCHMSACSWSD